MRFLFDNNLPPAWAAAFAAASARRFSNESLGEIAALRDKFAASTADLGWLEALGKQGGWTIVSCDAFRKQRGAERQVIREFGMSVFVLQASWATKPYWAKLSQFALWWPRIVDQANQIERSAFEVPWRISGRFRQL